MTFPVPETFEVDITNTKRLLEGERGQVIAQKDVIVSIFFDTSLVKSKKKKKEKKRKKIRFLCVWLGLFTLHVTCAELLTDHTFTNHTLLHRFLYKQIK
jgi:hypothetical protein